MDEEENTEDADQERNQEENPTNDQEEVFREEESEEKGPNRKQKFEDANKEGYNKVTIREKGESSSDVSTNGVPNQAVVGPEPPLPP